MSFIPASGKRKKRKKKERKKERKPHYFTVKTVKLFLE
jgi:hypothetical protein